MMKKANQNTLFIIQNQHFPTLFGVVIMTQYDHTPQQHFSIVRCSLLYSFMLIMVAIWSYSTRTAQAQERYSIRGAVHYEQAGLDGVSIVVRQQQGNLRDTVWTGQAGQFEITGLTRGTYELTAAKTGFRFSPLRHVVTVTSANITNIEFKAERLFSITGRLTRELLREQASSDIGVPNVWVRAVLPDSLQAPTAPFPVVVAMSRTDAQGYYTLEVPRGKYDVVAEQQQGSTILPLSRSVVIESSSSAGNDFRLGALITKTYSGRVVEAANAEQGVPNVRVVYYGVYAAGAGFVADTTNQFGTYSFTVPVVYQSGISVAMQPPCSFTPPSYIIRGSLLTPEGENQQYNFRRYCHNGSAALAGVVVSSSNRPVANVEVMLIGRSTNPDTVRTLTNAQGAYSFDGRHRGSYIVRCVHQAMTFVPREASVLLREGVTQIQDFVASSRKYNVSGSVAATTLPLPSVSVRLQGRNIFGEAVSVETRTDSAGRYVHSAEVGRYTLTPTLAGYTFTPETRTVSVDDSDVSGQNFVARSATFCLSGRIMASSAQGLPDVIVTLTPLTSATPLQPITTRTDADGKYQVCGLTNGMTYRIVPSKAGFAFRPSERTVVINNADVTEQNFTAVEQTMCISGRVLSSNATGLPNIEIRLRRLNATATEPFITTNTDASGTYRVCNLAAGTYSVQPISSSLSFTPEQRTVTLVDNDATEQNFVAVTRTFCVSGRVVDARGVAIAGVALSIGLAQNAQGTTPTPIPQNTQALLATTITDSNGEFRFCSLPNGSYNVGIYFGGPSVSPIMSRYTFSPIFRTVVVNGNDVTGINFVGMPRLQINSSVYPNPVSSAVTVRFQLEAPAQAVSIGLYSMNWQLLGTIVHSRPYPEGVHEVFYVLPGYLANGSYMLRIQADNASHSAVLNVQR